MAKTLTVWRESLGDCGSEEARVTEAIAKTRNFFGVLGGGKSLV